MEKKYSLTQKNKGRGILTWYVRIHENGKDRFVSLKTTDHDEAMEAYVSFKKDDEYNMVGKKPSEVDLHRELDRWIQMQEYKFGALSNTYHNYKGLYNLLDDYLKGERIHYLSEFTRSAAQGFANEQMSKGKKASSIEINLRVTKLFFRWIINTNEMVIRNPFDGVERPKVESKIAEFWTTDECDAIIAHASNESWKAFFGLQCYAGLRFFEARKVRIEDIKDGILTIRQDKTKKDAMIPISHKLQALLDDAIGGRERGSLFVGEIGTHHATADKYLKRAVRAAGLQDKGRAFMHRLRHSYASNLLRGGVNIKSVQTLGRWSSPNILLKHYAGVIPSDLTDAVNLL